MQTDMACGPKRIPASILKTFKKELSKAHSDQGLCLNSGKVNKLCSLSSEGSILNSVLATWCWLPTTSTYQLKIWLDVLYFYFYLCGHDATSFLGFFCYLKLNRFLCFKFDYLHKHGCLLLFWLYTSLLLIGSFYVVIQV